MDALIENQWAAVKRILHYLQGTTDYDLLLYHNSGSSLQDFIDVHWQQSTSDPIHGFSDLDWVGCPNDQHSTG